MWFSVLLCAIVFRLNRYLVRLQFKGKILGDNTCLQDNTFSTIISNHFVGGCAFYNFFQTVYYSRRTRKVKARMFADSILNAATGTEYLYIQKCSQSVSGSTTCVSWRFKESLKQKNRLIYLRGFILVCSSVCVFFLKFALCR